MSSIFYARLPELPEGSLIATSSERPEFYLIWFPPTGARRDWNVFRCEPGLAGARERVIPAGQCMGWHAFCVQAETMFGVRGGADHALAIA